MNRSVFQEIYGKAKAGEPSDEIAAVIALAMDMEQGGDVYAAIALAMDLYFNDTVHDAESFVLTLRPKEGSDWNDKKQNFRRDRGFDIWTIAQQRA